MSGARVDFTKSYVNGPPAQDKILYQGEISEDASMITGQWTMMSLWTGRFKMRRAIEQTPKAKAVLAAEIETV